MAAQDWTLLNCTRYVFRLYNTDEHNTVLYTSYYNNIPTYISRILRLLRKLFYLKNFFEQPFLELGTKLIYIYCLLIIIIIYFDLKVSWPAGSYSIKNFESPRGVRVPQFENPCYRYMTI